MLLPTSVRSYLSWYKDTVSRMWWDLSALVFYARLAYLMGRYHEDWAVEEGGNRIGGSAIVWIRWQLMGKSADGATYKRRTGTTYKYNTIKKKYRLMHISAHI